MTTLMIAGEGKSFTVKARTDDGRQRTIFKVYEVCLVDAVVYVINCRDGSSHNYPAMSVSLHYPGTS